MITAAMKNMMGTNWDRGVWHNRGLDQCIADYSTAVKADLIILDALQVLMNNGPKGPGEIKAPNPVSYTHLDVYKRQACKCVS